jgi:hypothetical protein
MQCPGSNRKLSPFQEDIVLLYIDRMDRAGSAPLISHVANAAQRILILHTKAGDTPPTLGRDWTKNFVRRHKDTCAKV